MTPSPDKSPSQQDAPPATPKKKDSGRLLTFSSGGWVLLLSAFFTLVAAGLVLYPIYSTGFHRSIGDGKDPDTYGFDLSNLKIPRNQLYASGNAKDQVRAVPVSLVETVVPGEVDLIAQNEHIRFLTPSDLVIGISIEGISRCYPVRILNLHEVVNDKIGNTPIAVTWSVLSGSAVVFDRRLEGGDKPTTEIGVSGLLYQSTLIFFDRHADTKEESLWTQLGFQAIAGPAAGKSFTPLPCDVMSWSDWRALHPETKVFLGLRTLKAEYGDAQDPYNMYIANDDLRFPVSPYWDASRFALKTRITAASMDGKHFVASLPEVPKPATTASAATQPVPAIKINAFLFAWYANHPDDTDFSAFK